VRKRVHEQRTNHCRMKRNQLTINTGFPPHQHPSFIVGPGPHTAPLVQQQPPFQPYPPPHQDGPGYYGPPPPAGYYPYPPPGHPGHMTGPPMNNGPVPGPSRRHSLAHGPPQMYPGPGQHQFPPQWDNGSMASSTISHKRKRSDSSLPRGGANLTPGREPMNEDEQRQPPRHGHHMPTPPSSGPPLSVLEEEGRPQNRGVYVTATHEEGRKLGLVHSATGSETKEGTPIRGPPRMKSTTTLSVSASGKAALASSEVLQTELDMLERSNQATPSSLAQTPNGNPRTPNSGQPASGPDAKDTPGTKSTKITRRLSAFNNSTPRPSEPMYSVRLDMGQGQPCRVALRKDLALAFVGLDKATKVVEESRKEDEDGWAVVNGDPGSRPTVRPDWPDEDTPWKIEGGALRGRHLREEKERTALLKRYLETSSDDEEDDDGAGRFPSYKGRAAQTRRPSAGRSPSNTTSDAKAALLSALNRSRRGALRRSAPPVFVPGGVISCVCKNTAAGGTLITCSSCRSWFHLGCIGLDNLQMADNWVCDPCVVQARRATLSSPSGRTPVAARYTHERSHSAFRGGDMALALAPSPMFAGDSGLVQATPMGHRTPFSPAPSRQRARVLSYGTDLWGSGGGDSSPTTPVPPPRIPNHFSTPRPEDSVFDVNSTPSRHLNTDPRMAGQFNSLFAVTPLMGRSQNAPGMLAQDTPVPGRRNVSGGPHANSDTGVVSRHEFLQGLTADRRVSATEGPPSPSARRGGAMLHDPVSPSPYGSVGRTNKFSNLRSGPGSRPGVGLGMPLGDRRRGGGSDGE
jgi:hypothetical protein